MTHKKILEMIENVSPNDTATMDEIDNLVEDYIYAVVGVCMNFKWPWKKNHSPECKYTRCRTSLKAIRPDGWRFFVHNMDDYRGHLCYATLAHDNRISIDGRQLPTEELSELHAIIQAIAYKRALTS